MKIPQPANLGVDQMKAYIHEFTLWNIFVLQQNRKRASPVAQLVGLQVCRSIVTPYPSLHVPQRAPVGRLVLKHSLGK